jgi:hypothetical protein
VHRLAGVPGEAQHARTIAAHLAAAQAGMAADAATVRPVVLRYAGAVLAMTSGLDTTVPNMARVYQYWLAGWFAAAITYLLLVAATASNPPP